MIVLHSMGIEVLHSMGIKLRTWYNIVAGIYSIDVIVRHTKKCI